ncbi:MAG: 23S rRNA (cytosine(1962)-C(5))-methyltransferase RlmI, partial [Actinomycetota bacterium]|nr:23S rRNA (cytosine(1962)-C(5))-methyltransferase RlmI [Actinomycetota bacterium]
MSTSPATIWLQPTRERSLARRHPWVFSGGVARVDGNPGSGDTVLVRAADGTELGWAAFSPSSQIRARMWSFEPSVPITPAFVTARVRAAAARRAALLGSGRTDSARLVFSEADGVPG